MKVITVVALVLILASSVYGLDKKAFQMRDDFGTEPLWDCYLSYYYYIPSPTYSWFWGFNNWAANDVIGTMFTIGDPTMGLTTTTCPPAPVTCAPCDAQTIQQFRVLDFAGYGTTYPGLYTVDFAIYCSDAQGSPVGAALWTSGPQELCVGSWTTIDVAPDLCVTECHSEPGAPYCYPRFLVTAKMIGSNPLYPTFGLDNISGPIADGSLMHDTGCCPALYPRPYVSHYNTIHSGYYGPDFTYNPGLWIADPNDTTVDYTQFGFLEWAWRVYMINSGPTGTEPSTWGNIKSMYR
jgi:hypothetical protein